MNATAAGRTILLVDDEDDIRDLLAMLLRRDGYAVLQAASAAEALRVAAAHAAPVDLLLTDLGLPGEDGAALAARMAASRRGLRVLYVSGSERREGMDPDAFLAKPFTPDGLSRKVREVLAG